MVESIKPFTEIQYITKDGAHIRATKNNGVVTVASDKDGIRQMSVNEFIKDMAANIQNINLEKVPNKDAFQKQT